MHGRVDLAAAGEMSSIAEVLAGSARWALAEFDCLDVLPMLQAGTVDHVITDPPYEAAAHTKQRRVKDGARTSDWGGRTNDPQHPALSFAPLTEATRLGVAEQASRLARRWTIAFCQVEAAMRWAEAFVVTGMMIRRIGVWVKPDAMPQFTGDRPGMGYESIVFAHAKGRSRWNGGGRTAVFTHNKNTPGGRHHHETQKPLPLMLELVELFTDPGDLVLDPFAGSGTTGVACLRLGRRFIGIERDATYAQVARERLHAESQGLTLRDARAGQMPMFPVEP